MGLKLFGDDDGDSPDLSKIEINEEFARRYEHNKKREDLQRFEELKKRGVVDSGSESDEDSSEEDEEILDVSTKKDLEFFDALIKVRNQDPSLKNQDAKLFDSDDDEEEGVEENENDGKEEKKKKKKPMYLKDVIAEHLIEKGPEFDDDGDEGEEKKKRKRSYFEEQELLRKEFLDAAGEDADDGEFLKVKEDQRGDEDGVDDEDVEFQKKLDEYFKEDEKLDENERFLKDYFRNKMWLDKDSGGSKVLDDGLDVSEDEEELERQEDYEREFNFRHEENADDRVMTFSRKVEGSVRKKDNARKLQRKNKEERMALAESQRKEELKHLKNLKKKEINEKLRKIRATAGIGDDEDCVLDEDDLEEEFDPDEYDRKMKKAFDEKYYDTNDVDPEFGSGEEDGSELEKPDFDKEDELLGLPKGWDDQYGSGDGFEAARERALKNSLTGKRRRQRDRSQREEEVFKEELEEYYKLDYEDTIGDLRTRFKYKPVKRSKPLSAPYILLADDKELNQIVPIKKIAPYADDEFKVSRRKVIEHKQRIKSLLKGETSDGSNKLSSKHARKESDERSSKLSSNHASKELDQRPGASESENQQPGEQNHSRKKERNKDRKKRQKELKPNLARMKAYGVISSKSKKK